MMIPGPVLEALKSLKSPLWPILVGLVLLAKRAPTQMHSVIDYLASVGEFLWNPENAASIAMIGAGLAWWAKRNGNQGDRFEAAVQEAIAKQTPPAG